MNVFNGVAMADLTEQSYPLGLEESQAPFYMPPFGRSGTLFGRDGLIEIDEVVDRFGMSKGQFAEMIGLAPETLRRTSRLTAAKTQMRMTEVLEIVTRVTDWAGGEKQAMAWYRAEPIPAFGGRTAESLVKDGKAPALRDYLDHLAMGGFA
jgi:uncharacterized protein (DUF2384 family)